MRSSGQTASATRREGLGRSTGQLSLTAFFSQARGSNGHWTKESKSRSEAWEMKEDLVLRGSLRGGVIRNMLLVSSSVWSGFHATNARLSKQGGEWMPVRVGDREGNFAEETNKNCLLLIPIHV